MFKLTRYETTAAAAVDNNQQWTVRVEALNSEDDTPAKVFVMQDAAPGEFGVDSFSCVASAVQIHDLPEDASAPDSVFFRTHDITVHHRNADASLEFWTKIQKAVQQLADNLRASDNLSTQEEVTITAST